MGIKHFVVVVNRMHLILYSHQEFDKISDDLCCFARELEIVEVKIILVSATMALLKNPITIAIPCHRVIGTNGKLVGYAGGLQMKRDLLKIEKNNN